MNWRDLILTPKGTISHTKLWANIGFATATAIILYQTWKSGITADLLLVYMGTVGLSAGAHKLFALKYGLPTGKDKP